MKIVPLLLVLLVPAVRVGAQLVRTWPVGPPSIVWQVTGFSDSVEVNFSPDGKFVYVASNGHQTVKKVELSTGRLIWTKPMPQAPLCMTVNPAGSMLAVGCHTNGVFLLDSSTGSQLSFIWPALGNLAGLTLSPDGNHLFVAAFDGGLSKWRISDGSMMWMVAPSLRHNAVTISQNGQLLATGAAYNDNSVWLWHPMDGSFLGQLTGHAHDITGVGFSPSGDELYSASIDGTIRVWNPNAGTEIRRYAGPQRLALACSSDGTMLVAGNWVAYDRGEAELLQVSDGTKLWTFMHTYPVSAVAFSRDSSLVASAAREVQIHETAEPGTTPIQFGGEHTGAISSAVFSPDGSLILAAEKDAPGSLYLYRSSDRALIRKLEHSTLGNYDIQVAFNAEGSNCYYSRGNILIVRSIPHFGFVGELWHPGNVYSIAPEPNGDRIATSCADGFIRIWDTSTGEALVTIPVSVPAFNGLAWAPAGNFLYGVGNDRIFVWQSSDGALSSEWPCTWPNQALMIKISQDGRYLAAGCDSGQVRIWNTSTGALAREWDSGYQSIQSVAFDRTGRLLVASCRSSSTFSVAHGLKVWDVRSGALIRHYNRAWVSANQLDGSPDDSTMIAARPDATLAMLDLGGL